MKMMNVKRMAAVMITAVFAAGAYAQVYTLPSVSGEGTDSVAIGSKAKYQVTRDPAVSTPLFNASGFWWTNNGGFTFEQTNGSPLTATGGSGAQTPDGAYDQNEVVMNVTGPVGSYQVTAAEQSRPITGSGCVDPTPEVLPVVVVNLPTMAFGADSGGCGAPASNLLVPATVTGYGKYDIRLHVAAYDLSANPIGTAQDVDITNHMNAYTTHANTPTRLTVTVAQLQAAAGGSFPPAGCYFDISATNMQDRISKKHHNYAFNVTEVTNNNPASGDTYRFYIYPVPTTQPIQHIQNNW